MHFTLEISFGGINACFVHRLYIPFWNKIFWGFIYFGYLFVKTGVSWYIAKNDRIACNILLVQTRKEGRAFTVVTGYHG